MEEQTKTNTSAYRHRAARIALAFVLLGTLGTGAYLLKEQFAVAAKMIWVLDQAVYWLFWLVPAACALAGAALVVKQVTAPRDDPLFSPRITMLLLVVLLRLGWAVPTAQMTMVQMVFDPSGICQIILVIMVAGFAANVVQFLNLRNEFQRLQGTELQLADSGADAQTRLQELDQIMFQTYGTLKSKWENLRESLKHARSAEFETLMSFPNQREILKESKLSFIIKILPLLGMVGTVLGFTLAIVGMQTAATNMLDFTSFKGNMLQALGGMKSAFLTTLAGMAGMILVMWLNSTIEESRRRILLLEDEFLYIRFFLPWQHQQQAADSSPH